MKENEGELTAHTIVPPFFGISLVLTAVAGKEERAVKGLERKRSVYPFRIGS